MIRLIQLLQSYTCINKFVGKFIINVSLLIIQTSYDVTAKISDAVLLFGLVVHFFFISVFHFYVDNDLFSNNGPRVRQIQKVRLGTKAGAGKSAQIYLTF